MRLGRGIHRHLTSVAFVVRLNDESRVLPGVPRLFCVDVRLIPSFL